MCVEGSACSVKWLSDKARDVLCQYGEVTFVALPARQIVSSVFSRFLNTPMFSLRRPCFFSVASHLKKRRLLTAILNDHRNIIRIISPFNFPPKSISKSNSENIRDIGRSTV